MAEIYRKITIAVPVEKAFFIFVQELGKWWPREYTWSQNTLQTIKIDPCLNGLCTEIGPYGFRIDWGRVTVYEENKSLHLKWQISPQRVPEPDPGKGSDIEVKFESVDEFSTSFELVHKNFKNHGEGAAEYQKAMDAEFGWDYILNSYKEYLDTGNS